MDPCNQMVTTVMPREMSIVSAIYVDSMNTPRLENEAYIIPNGESRNTDKTNNCSIPIIEEFQNQCSAAADVQDVLTTALSESQIDLSNVQVDHCKDLPKDERVNIGSGACDSKPAFQDPANSDRVIFPTVTTRNDGRNTLDCDRDIISADVQSDSGLPNKPSNITTVQNGIVSVLDTVPQCLYYDLQPSFSQRDTIDEHGLKILADVISHKPVAAGVDSVCSIVPDNGTLSTSSVGIVSSDVTPICQTKPREGRLDLGFPPDVIDVWTLLEDNQTLHLTGSSPTNDEALKLQMKRSKSGFHLSLGGCCLETCLEKESMNAWTYALSPISECGCIRRDVADLLNIIRSRRTSDIGVQVCPEMLIVNATRFKKRGGQSKKRRNTGRPTSSVEERNRSCCFTSVMTRSGRSGDEYVTTDGCISRRENGGEIQHRTIDVQTASTSLVPSSTSNRRQTDIDASLKESTVTSESVDPNEEMNETSQKVNVSSCALDEMVTESANGEQRQEVSVSEAIRNSETETFGPGGESEKRGSDCCDDVGKAAKDNNHQHYRHSIKSSRSLNKELYELNGKVAEALKYTDSGDRQTCIICGNVSPHRWLLLLHLRRFHVMNPEDYLMLLKWPPAKRERELDRLRKSQWQATKRHSPKRAGTLPCHFCGEQILGIQNMKRHLKVEHGRLPAGELAEKVRYYTDEYGKLIHRNRMVAMRKANLTKTEFPCRYCGRPMAMSCTRSRHEIYRCPKNPDRRKRYNCSCCGTSYRTQDELVKHRARHAQHDFKFVCDKCGKEYRTKPMLHEHKMTVHLGREPKYVCSICQKSFHYRDKLEKHLVAHSDKRDVMCDVCGKLFKTKDDVQKHTRYVHKRRYPHHCDRCGHGVAKLRYLETHKCGRVRRGRASDTQPRRRTESAAEPAGTGTYRPAGDPPTSGQPENAMVAPPSECLASAQFGESPVGSVGYRADDGRQSSVVVSVEQFMAGQCPADIGYAGVPATLSLSQFVGPLPVGPVYALSDGGEAGSGRVQQLVDGGTLLQPQQQQLQPGHHQQQQQMTHVVSGETVQVVDYKMSPYQE